MILTCPSCHARYSLEISVEDESARDLLALKGVEVSARIWPLLVAYMGLFRAESRALAWSRALRIARETMELTADHAVLEAALADTVEALRAKRDQGDKRPLKDHNYLKSVLKSCALRRPAGFAVETTPGVAPRGKRAAALAALEEWGGSDWLRAGIAQGLQAIVALNLKGAPAVDTVTLSADIWHATLKTKLTVEQVDTPRLSQAFGLLFPTLTEWPQPKQLIELLPPRPERAKLPSIRPTDEQLAEGRAHLRALRERL
ncbi:hypothetical protein [Geobacter sp.]|uniref:hypothetical protein n=1 Tax=Geobacter sp. TaxID=46610 RepID=UPI0026231482|nr:hypothetical protein [Geobacter sp.]